MGRTLVDLGERAIIRTILPRFVQGVGDDCGFVQLEGAELVLTTDPVPTPAAGVIGGDSDLYWMGRLLVTINASDLAAAGASPVAFLAAIDAPSDLLVTDLERLLLGIKEGCQEEGLVYSGGNLRESKQLTAVGSAIGLSVGRANRRRGAQPGDLLVSVGQGGIFWRDALFCWQGGVLLKKTSSPLFQPRSQINLMAQLTREGLVKAAIDNSDGLLPSLFALAESSRVSVALDLESLTVPANETGVDPVRLWLGWGDWNVLAAINREDFARAAEIASQLGSVIFPIGEFSPDPEAVILTRGETRVPAPRLESERFSKDSWFIAGIGEYIRQLLELEIP